jgi:hypothetical protein
MILWCCAIGWIPLDKLHHAHSNKTLVEILYEKK